MKTLLKIGEMLQYLPTAVKDAVHHVAKETGNKTDDLELHRHTHSEKSRVNGLDPKSRCALKYVSARTQDRDDEIVIPEVIQLAPFRKYMHVLFNHNYSLPPIGSDRTIEADDFGIKALTEYADTGAGTMANVMWALVSQGHQKASSIGFVPTSFTKPGARDWDHVANQLQSNWKEFDKSRAEKSISRIITGGVLLEHSDVTVPCNVDAEMVQVIKALNVEDKVLKQFGWEMKDGILVNKAVAEKVPSVCDECGLVEDAVPGSKCPECKTGDMKPKGKEKAIEVRVVSKGMGTLSSEDLRQSLQQLVMSKPSSDMNAKNCWVYDIFEDRFIFNKEGELYSQGYTVVENKPQLVGEPVKVERRTSYVRVVGKGGPGSGNFGHAGRPGEVGGSGNGGGGTGEAKESIERSISHNEIVHISYSKEAEEYLSVHSDGDVVNDSVHEFWGEKDGENWRVHLDKSFHSRAVEKPNPHMPGGSFTACVAIMEDKGHDTESAKKICGALQADAGGKGLTEAETKAVEEITGVHKAMGIPCTCDECGAEDECAPGSPCQKDGCEGVMRASKKMEKEYTPVVMVVKPAPQIKVLYVPPDADLIAKRVSDAVEKTLARRTGKIL